MRGGLPGPWTRVGAGVTPECPGRRPAGRVSRRTAAWERGLGRRAAGWRIKACWLGRLPPCSLSSHSEPAPAQEGRRGRGLQPGHRPRHLPPHLPSQKALVSGPALASREGSAAEGLEGQEAQDPSLVGASAGRPGARREWGATRATPGHSLGGLYLS